MFQVQLKCKTKLPIDNVLHKCANDLTDTKNDHPEFHEKSDSVQKLQAVLIDSTTANKFRIHFAAGSTSKTGNSSAFSFFLHDKKAINAYEGSTHNSHDISYRYIDDSTVEKSRYKDRDENENKNERYCESFHLSFLKVVYEKVINICNAAFQYSIEGYNCTSKTPQHQHQRQHQHQHILSCENKNENGATNSYGNNNEYKNSTKKRNKNENKIPVWNGVHSLLICAPEGAGKSYLLTKIENYFLKTNHLIAENENLKSEIIVLKLSGKFCDHPPLPSSTFDLDLLPTFHASDGFNKRVRHHLFQCIQIMKTDDISTNIDLKSMEEQEILRVVLLINDLDTILLQFNSNDDDDASGVGADSGKGMSTEIAAFHLRQLITLLAIPNNGNDQIIVVGATRISSSSLPRCHIGDLPFNMIMTLTHFY